MNATQRRVLAAATAAFLLTCLAVPVEPNHLGIRWLNPWDDNLNNSCRVDWVVVVLRAVGIFGVAAIFCLLTGGRRRAG